MTEKKVPLITAVKTPQSKVLLDPKGFFVIEVHKDRMVVEYYENVVKNDKIVSGNLQKVFEGTRADALCDTIARHLPNLRPEHYLYLGRELMKAQQAFDNHTTYIQGGC